VKKLLARFVRVSPAMVVATAALFVALTGTAVATTSALITGNQIKNASITGLDIKNKSVGIADLATKARGARGARGVAGPPGPVGPQGPAGTPNPNAVNSDKLDGFDASSLVRATSAMDPTDNNDFDTCAFTTVQTKAVNAPTDGILILMGSLNGAKDVSDPDPSAASFRLAVDGVAATEPLTQTFTTTGGIVDSSVTMSGAIAVGAGSRSVTLQAQECSAGMLYIDSKAITTLFVPFGNEGTGTLSVPPAAGASQSANQ
jgi:hypothetical protein